MGKRLDGYRAKRLTDVDDLGIPYSVHERWLVGEFNKERNPKQYLTQIINPPRGYLTDDEVKVAMTMLQWLGTGVGSAFYEAAMKKAKHQIDTFEDVRKRIRSTQQRKRHEQQKENT